MLPTPQKYVIYPSVVVADQATEMIVAPAERVFCLFEGEEYIVSVYPINSDRASDYRTPGLGYQYTVTAHDGIIRFTHTFEDEQQHVIFLEKDEKKLSEFMVYSLRKDLYALTPLRGDLHGHSHRSDGHQDPAALAGHYREQGYDFFALTDHNRYYPGDEIDEVYKGVKLGITHVPGEEVHAPGSVVHIVHVGGNKSVANEYIHNREQFEKDVDEYRKQIPEQVAEEYHDRYAKMLWATDKIHEAGGLAIFAHPYWRPKGRVYNVCDELATHFLKSGKFDAYELVGGMKQVGINRSVAFWNDLRADGLKISVVGSSDVHALAKAETFPHLFTICFAKSDSVEDILEAVKSGNSVAVEACGTEYERQYRAYGSLRLVSYAQFLLTHFFPARQRVCQGEGIAMRAFAMGEADATLVEALAEQSNNFRARFFGRMQPRLPDADMLALENKWRERHIAEGPVTKGSVIDSDVVNRQI